MVWDTGCRVPQLSTNQPSIRNCHFNGHFIAVNATAAPCGMKFRVLQGLRAVEGRRVWDERCKVQGVGCRV